jgi:glycosyltransferase involved in cell wall biosynthesis
LKARWRCRFVYYCQDLYPGVAEALGKIRSPALLSLLDWANGVAHGNADRIVVLGADMKEKLAADGVDAERIEILPNWVDCSAVRPLAYSAFRERFGEKFVVMYSGNLGFAQPLEVVLEAAGLLREERDLVFVFVGDGASKPFLEERARCERLSNVVFLPYQPKEALSASLSAADLHLVPLRRGLAGLMVPSKVYGVLAAGRPFVAMMEEHAEVARMARRSDVGFVSPPDDAPALAALLRSAAAERERLREMGRRARELAERSFDRPTATARFGEMLQQVSEPQS